MAGENSEWKLSGAWRAQPAGLRAAGEATAAWGRPLPLGQMLELTLALDRDGPLPDEGQLWLHVGPPADPDGGVSARLQFQGEQLTADLLAPRLGTEQRAQATFTAPAAEHLLRGRGGRHLALALEVCNGSARLYLNGCFTCEVPLPDEVQRSVLLLAQELTVARVASLAGPGGRFLPLSGAGLAQPQGALRSAAAPLPLGHPGASTVLQVEGVPFMLTSTDAGRLGVLDAGAERWQSGTWSEGSGLLTARVPTRLYSAAYLLLRDTGMHRGRAAALGTGLRVFEESAGDLHNVYLEAARARSSDHHVEVTALPQLGPGWHLARIRLNPATLHWYTHAPGGELLTSAAPHGPDRPPSSRGMGPDLRLYFGRPWVHGSGLPRPAGPPSSLQVAAVTLEHAQFDLQVAGNGLGNVYSEPDQPRLAATLRSFADQPLHVQIARELLPIGRPARSTTQRLTLAPGETATFEALAGAVEERGHYRVRVLADAGAAGRVDYRTNLAVLAADTRLRDDSIFGSWSRLWEDRATDEQRDYLRDTAGIGFLMSKHNYGHFVGRQEYDEESAEELVRQLGPDVRVFMLGWEHNWSIEHTFAMPRIILEGKPEELSEEIAQQADRIADEMTMLVRALRRLRPDIKISLGNSAVNYHVPLLERGLRYPEDFDYFGTEEGLFSVSPERPATAIGNVNWWARAICEHFGFRDVPLFKSECFYYATGPGFARMDAERQAAYYVRTHLLGLPYDSVFGLVGAIVDSSNRYIYSNWGMSAYCHQAPECSPKPSYVAYATLTELLDGAQYRDWLDTGTTSAYALRFTDRSGAPLCAVWNLRGERRMTLRLADPAALQVVDGYHRPVAAEPEGDLLTLAAGPLPLYVRGAEVLAASAAGPRPADRPEGHRLLAPPALADWSADPEPDPALEAPGEWTGVPRVQGTFAAQYAPVGDERIGALVLRQTDQPAAHGLVPRYVSLRPAAGQEIPIPAGTIRLGLWVYGNSTWAEFRLGLRNAEGRRWLVGSDAGPVGEAAMKDNGDGWMFMTTGDLGWDVAAGDCVLDRIVVTMPQQQVYVDQLLTTAEPQVAIAALYALSTTPDPVNYLPW